MRRTPTTSDLSDTELVAWRSW